MKFVANTVSKPVVGKAAKKLKSAINSGSHVANAQSVATMNRILERYGKKLDINVSK